MEQLLKSGFAFFANVGENKIILENKFTGLRILYDDSTKTWEPIDEKIF